MNIIQIEVTNACESRCGACTRLVPHVAKPFFLSIEQFERACASMRGWQGGVLGVMGGNPPLHPQFERLSRRFADIWGRTTLAKNGRAPIKNFSAYAQERLFDQSSGRGLWSSLGRSYCRHYETIQEVYDYQCLNDHMNPGLHQGLLISREEFCRINGITDDEWVRNRDKCWVQNTWSASINHHGAYFCEVAAAIDDLFFGGKSAWPVEPGWWQRGTDDFKDQLHLCDHCALAQPGPSLIANHDIDVVGEQTAKRLKEVDSPAIRKGKVEIYAPTRPPASPRDFRIDWYMPEPLMRVSPKNTSMKPQRISCVVVCVDWADDLKQTLPHNAPLVDLMIVVTHPDDKATQYVASEVPGVRLVLSDACFRDDAAFNKGAMLNAGLGAINHFDWVLFTDADVRLDPETPEYVMSHALNPGCLYGARRVNCNGDADDVTIGPTGFFQLWHLNALALRKRDPSVPICEKFCSAGGVDSWFTQQYPPDKRVMLPLRIVHMNPTGFAQGWNGQRKGRAWRQIGMITTQDFYPLWEFPPLNRLRLTDTLYGQQTEIKIESGKPIPSEIVRHTPDGLVFLGQDIGHHHIHVAAFVEG